MNNSKRRREAIQSAPKGPSGTFAGVNRRTRRHGEVVTRPFTRVQHSMQRLAALVEDRIDDLSQDTASIEDERSDEAAALDAEVGL